MSIFTIILVDEDTAIIVPTPMPSPLEGVETTLTWADLMREARGPLAAESNEPRVGNFPPLRR